MAKKQKAQDKKDLKDDSIELETETETETETQIDIDIDVDDSKEDDLGPSLTDNSEILNAEEKIKDLEEALLRSRAELDNAFKRNTADIEKAHKYGVERLLHELLPVVDNLEHALNNFSKDSTKEDKEGVELTLKSFESALDKFGIRPIYPLNEQFDPIKHEAVMTSKDPKKENNEIENIFQRGWELHERVVRPARVSVIKN
jgi:molecular chaperone GrpE